VRKARTYCKLEAALGYRFKDEALLERALTHASVRSGRRARADNERLEFIGDRVLGLAIAETLLAVYPEDTEGQIARRYNRLVRGETCAAVARRVELGEFLILSDSEAGSGGREKDTILADAIEAVLGAIFLEGGFDKARTIVNALWEPYTESLPNVASDPKSALQEWAQGRGFELPKYVEVARKGPDHAPHFTSEVRIKGFESARGDGASKRAAEQAAATRMLVQAGVWKASGDD